MKIREVARIAWDAILKNKIRSLLTMLGIIIGVAAVIMVVSISAGTEATISDQITGPRIESDIHHSQFRPRRTGELAEPDRQRPGLQRCRCHRPTGARRAGCDRRTGRLGDHFR